MFLAAHSDNDNEYSAIATPHSFSSFKDNEAIDNMIDNIMDIPDEVPLRWETKTR